MASMSAVMVELGSNSYEVRIGASILAQAGPWLKKNKLSGRAVVIADAAVNALYGDALRQSLAGAGLTATTLEVPPGEEHKTLDSAARLYREMTEALAERSTPVLALGGGVAGDLAGFVAATYMRGVPLVQVPTTLLAQVDSSVGGKTAVDHEQLKNMIGVFYQPRLVIADVSTLKTLPEAELTNGLAEVVKHAAIRSRSLFEYLEASIDRARSRETAVLEEIVRANVEIKAGVVARDEKEQGLRGILNYGHTIGHAIEAVSDFRLKHGQAVAIGMAAAARISVRMNMLREDEAARLEALLKKAGLPTAVPDMDITRVISAMRHDKKVQGQKVRFVLLKSLGEAVITDKVSPSLVEEVLRGEG